MSTLKITRLRAEAVLPRYMTAGAAGMDLAAALAEAISLRPGERLLVPTGIAIELPSGYEGQVRPRSGLAARHGVTVLNAPGTIDSDYRGEVKVVLIHHGDAPLTIEPGMRIAQLVLAPVVQLAIEESLELAATDRGAGGFGHTGTLHTETLHPEQSPHSEHLDPEGLPPEHGPAVQLPAEKRA